MARIPLPNEVVLAPYHDGVYYRVVVKDITEDQLACSGEFIDYGDARTVLLAELRDLNAEICEVSNRLDTLILDEHRIELLLFCLSSTHFTD